MITAGSKRWSFTCFTVALPADAAAAPIPVAAAAIAGGICSLGLCTWLPAGAVVSVPLFGVLLVLLAPDTSDEAAFEPWLAVLLLLKLDRRSG